MLDKQKAITVKNVGHIISSGMEEKLCHVDTSCLQQIDFNNIFQKHSRNKGKHQYTYRSLILHLLKYNLVWLRKEDALWTTRVYPGA